MNKKNYEEPKIDIHEFDCVYAADLSGAGYTMKGSDIEKNSQVSWKDEWFK